jgi:hypothetical protein
VAQRAENARRKKLGHYSRDDKKKKKIKKRKAKSEKRKAKSEKRKADPRHGGQASPAKDAGFGMTTGLGGRRMGGTWSKEGCFPTGIGTRDENCLDEGGEAAGEA